MLKKLWNFLFNRTTVDVSVLTNVINNTEEVVAPVEVVIPPITKTHDELATIVNERIKEIETSNMVAETPSDEVKPKPKKKKYYNNKKKAE